MAAPGILMASFSTPSLVALFLSALGLHGVLAFHVVRRTREIGIRVAMGAGGEERLGSEERNRVPKSGIESQLEHDGRSPSKLPDTMGKWRFQGPRP